MSCNGCRVLRKGCGNSCILRPCLNWIESSEAQGNATVFVAKFFGRATLMSFISGVPESQRPALFKSLLFEACGRTINPLSGSVGLLGTGNWHLCQVAVATVLRGGSLCSLTEAVCSSAGRERVEVEGDGDLLGLMLTKYSSFSGTNRRKRERSFDPMSPPPCNPSPFPRDPGIPRPVLSSLISGDSVTALGGKKHDNNPPRLLNLFI